MKKIFLSVVIFVVIFLSNITSSFCAEKIKYEYKVVPLGSLTSLQKSKESASKTSQLEALLNEHGKDGWDIAEIFAVRTTFDPNVFFVIMKRPLN